MVKAYTTHERSVLEQVTELRGAARTVSQDDVAARAKAEGALSAASARVVRACDGRGLVKPGFFRRRRLGVAAVAAVAVGSPPW
jgi:hypothetical protein